MLYNTTVTASTCAKEGKVYLTIGNHVNNGCLLYTSEGYDHKPGIMQMEITIAMAYMYCNNSLEEF